MDDPTPHLEPMGMDETDVTHDLDDARPNAETTDIDVDPPAIYADIALICGELPKVW